MRTLLSLSFLFIVCAGSAQRTDEQLQKLIDPLSQEEKAYLLIGTGMDIPGLTEGQDVPPGVVGTTSGKVPGAAGTSYIIKKLGLPSVVFADGPAGIRINPERPDAPGATFYATAFPTASSLAATWNLDLINQVGHAFGEEGREYGIDFLLAPALNIKRNPLGGRNFEYYSEDPLVSGKIAAAFVNGVQAEGIGATIKHFVANNSETNRMALNTVVSERALREIYLRGFEIALRESDPWAVMSSYNKINGTYASENNDLLTKLLREEWHYDGFVMTDWFAGRDAVAQMKAGNDLLMPGTTAQSAAILQALKDGSLREAALDQNIKRILKQYYKTPSFKGYSPSGKPDLEAHKKLVRNAAAEGAVLLKNNNALPLKEKAKIALLGVTSYETIAGGTGSGDVNKAYMVSVTEGLKNAGYLLDEETDKAYTGYITEEKGKIAPKKYFFEKDVLVKEKPWTREQLDGMADRNDIALFTLGRTSGEFQDRAAEGDFYLTSQERSLITDIAEAFQAKDKKFILILNTGGVIETDSWKAQPDGILLSWQPGQEAGNAIADVLSGAVNPSAKLPVTFPVALADLASSANFPGKALDPNAPEPKSPLEAVPSEEVYEEGIYVGYRYFDTFKVPVSFPFGFGLSYTSFDYTDLAVTKNDAEIAVEFNVTNTGAIAGKEIVQLYVKAPGKAIERPEKALKGFAKTQLLKPGESQRITISLSEGDLAYFDTDNSAWVLEDGLYSLLLASDSKSIRLQTDLSLHGKEIRKTQKLLSPQTAIHELHKN